MVKLNPSFSRLNTEYIFSIIDRKLLELKKKLPSAELINFSIGDIALPIAPSIIKAITQAMEEMGTPEGIKGYGPSIGYDFLRQAIAEKEFNHLGISWEEIFISDGTNSDAVNILDLFSPQTSIGIPNPTYPAYLNSTLLTGRKKILSFPCLPENDFAPLPPQDPCDVIYLCSPNNPTGMAMTTAQLQSWIDYARKHRSLLLIDSAYIAFITSPNVPRSIYELPGAHECAIEMRTFSKSAGFTGLRCAYMVIPKHLTAALNRKKLPLHEFWSKRQGIKFNGVAYPIQKAAEAALSPEGERETKSQVQLYIQVAKRLKRGLQQMGHTCWGGEDAPYIWWKTPHNLTSWDFFDQLLNRCQIICVPGKGFGSCGEGYVRLSAFSSLQQADLALTKIKQL